MNKAIKVFQSHTITSIERHRKPPVGKDYVSAKCETIKISITKLRNNGFREVMITNSKFHTY